LKTDVDGERAQPAACATDVARQRIDPQSSSSIVIPISIGRLQPAGTVLSSRLISHITMLALIALALVGARMPWVKQLNAPRATGAFQQRILLLRPRYRTTPASLVSNLDTGFLQRRMPPHTEHTMAAAANDFTARGGSTFLDAGFLMAGLDPESSTLPLPRTQPVSYTVRTGDTLWTIGQKFNLEADTLSANNELSNPNMLALDTELLIPPVDGLWYKVKSGDTIQGLAQRYKTTAEAILDFAPNELTDGDKLTEGQMVMIPGGRKPAPVPARRVVAAAAKAGSVTGAGTFIMPTTGRFTQGFWARHPAIDISAPKGTAVYAADSGVVSFAGWHPWGYGYAVEIDHGNGYRSLYAHLSWYAPDAGQTVKRGELIGGVGSTYGSGGYSSGPHLHFEVVQNGAKRNPCAFVACP
jgi:murein DD-endopeptidase MepM/ murein hydrolase activator NlpD